MKTRRRDKLGVLEAEVRQAACPAGQIAGGAPSIPLATVLLMIGRLTRRRRVRKACR